jgi:eukaryotic-like serine/threonine-protein kinase
MACNNERMVARFVRGELEAGASEHVKKILDKAETVTLSQEPAEADLEAADPPLPRGAKVGRYLLLDVLGRGGMGVVYAAYDPELDRKIAIKLVRAFSPTPVAQARLLREAQAMARLSSPNVIAVHDVGTYGDRVFLAMELVEGGTLREWMRAQPPAREILKTFELAGRGLAAAHSAGLVHRDFKPDNVLVGKDGRVRVTDFGLARPVAAADTQATPEPVPERQLLDKPLTATGTLAGTPVYMAPEQLEGHPADARTDQFSFCVALYEALHGKRPFPGSSGKDLIEAIRSGKIEQPDADSVPAWLRTILLKGLAADPAQRFASMQDLLEALSRDPAAAPRRASASARWQWAGTGLLVLLTAALGAGLARRFALRGAEPREDLERTVAVLPFASLGNGPENAYFAEGFHEELLRQMAKIGDLRLISRNSVLPYKNGPRNLREIGEALHVAFVVEGSVQRAGNRVRVEAKLIDARADRQRWADRYDRDVTDVFAIQAALSEQIAGALQIRLSATERARLARKPTASAEAYDQYLRGFEYASVPDHQPEIDPVIGAFYRKAIRIDPTFALAHSGLSYVLISTFWWINGTPDSVAEEAKAEAEEALLLQPDLSEAHIALGLYYYWGRRDYEHALKEFDLARTGASGGLPLFWSSAVLRRQGNFEEAINRQQQATRLEYRASWIVKELALSLTYARRYEEADRTLDRALSLEPRLISASLLKAFVHEAWKGETDVARKLLRDLRGKVNAQGQVGGWDYFGDLLQHNPRDALSMLDSLEAPWIIGSDAAFPKAFLSAVAHQALGDPARARKEYQAAVPLLESRVDERPGNARERALLAQAYAALGRNADALREAARAAETLPVSKDALLGADVAVDRALAEAHAGAIDSAIEHIRQLLSIPSLLSPAMLRIDPRWAPLRDDPRFRQLAEM